MFVGLLLFDPSDGLEFERGRQDMPEEPPEDDEDMKRTKLFEA